MKYKENVAKIKETVISPEIRFQRRFLQSHDRSSAMVSFLTEL